ncbi:DSC E3 ubiquitin ligase complex subunit 1 [Rhizoctonia solani]|uniref:RING-type E3 ubiquitin transferase n=1 Tax=Rhizoctonia solani TaxID=456999 RepID=A0A0K6G0N1_9AGAM|nr:DSC E3 ubiquitin ligase complex subunit 1 [Rhizoctonia solani]
MEAPLAGAATTTSLNPNQARSSLTSLLLISIVLFLLSGDDPAVQVQQEDALRTLEYQQSNYTAWLNGTASNFTLEDTTNVTSPIVDALLPARLPIDGSKRSYFTNITGFVNGPATFFNLSDPSPSNYTWNWNKTAGPLVSGLNHTKANASLGNFHWSGIDKIAGNVRELRINESTPYSFLAGHIDFVNSKDDVLVNYQLDAIHFFEEGSIYGLMEPRGLEPDLRQLIPLVPTPVQNITSYAIKDEIDRQIRVLQDRIKNPGGGQAEDKNSITTCSFQLYGQIKAAEFPVYLMQELESETEEPTGVRTVTRPPLRLSGLILSPDCAVALTFKDAVGMQATIFWQKATMYSFVASICYFVILRLIVRQMETSRTPASIAKISRWTFALQAIADAYSFVGHVTVGIVSESRSSLSIIAPGFLAATLFLVFEVRFSMLIHQIQGPEDAVMRAPVTPAPTAPPTTDEAETPLLSNPPAVALTSPQTNTPSAWMVRVRRGIDAARSFIDSMTDPDSKFWIMILFAFLFLVQITVSPRLVLYAVGALYSFWVPQIMRNVKRGTRKALQKRYVIGTTLCRLFFPLYIFVCPGNVLFAERQPWIWLVAGWALFQCAVLAGQEYLGPSFFLPKGLVEIELYDWHPPIARPDTEAPNPSLGDCAICMDDILLETPDTSGGTESGSLLAGVGMGTKCVYAVAPCHHIFHTKCLEQWLAIKNICPQCRRSLPPL